MVPASKTGERVIAFLGFKSLSLRHGDGVVVNVDNNPVPMIIAMHYEEAQRELL